MFYIRSNTSSKKVIEKNVLLEEGLKKVENSNEDISLMYQLPNGKGIKIMLSCESNEYSLSIEGYPSKKAKQIISTSSVLRKLYLDIKDMKIEPGFTGKIFIREKATDKEVAVLSGDKNIQSVIRDISMPLCKIQERNIEIENNIQEQEYVIEEVLIPPISSVDDIPEVKVENKERKSKARSGNDIKSENSGKFTSYNISGTLRSGSSVILSSKIDDYKLALAKYNEAKENSCGYYKEICLNGYREDGSYSVRFKKTFDSEILSYDYISSFIKDLGDRIKLLSILEKDAKSAMAIEDKRYNAAYHIMEVCNMDLDNPSFRENMLKMKIAADKRRDMKKSVHLLSTINSLFSVPDTLTESIETCIERINVQTEQGFKLYKDKNVDDFVKEYEVSKDAVNLGDITKNKLTVRPLEIEGKMVVYEKHYKKTM